jgi:FkbM family methyltransferase
MVRVHQAGEEWIFVSLTDISVRTWLGKFLRWPMKLIPPKAIVPILRGKLKGLKWIAGAGISSYWLGTYEDHHTTQFAKIIKEGEIVFDIGAHVGFYTLLASLLVGPRGRVYSFEPCSENLFYLKEHLRLNGIANVVVLETAVADRCDYAAFQKGENRSEGRLCQRGNLRVKIISLDELIAHYELPVPNYLKIDVEGAEYLVLKGAEATIGEHHPTIFLSLHGSDLREQCGNFLRRFNYHLEPTDRRHLNDSGEILAYYEH